MALLDVSTGDELLAHALGPQRLAASLFGAFGALAAVLASLGLASLIGYSVRRRRREFAIRMALGATPGSVLGQVLESAVMLWLSGAGLGLGAAAILAPLVASRLGGTLARDPSVFALVAVALLAVSLAAACGPALRAARLAPHSALRQD